MGNLSRKCERLQVKIEWRLCECALTSIFVGLGYLSIYKNIGDNGAI